MNLLVQRGFVLAHYTGSSVTSWLLNGEGHFAPNQDFTYTLPHPGPDPSRQDAPHEHEAILDPTGQYILVPDLGRRPRTSLLLGHRDTQTLKPSRSTPSSSQAPAPPCRLLESLLASLARAAPPTSTLLLSSPLPSRSYAVTYKPNGDGLSFEKVYESTTFGLLKLPAGNAPAEIHVTPDNKYITISNRGDNSFNLTEPDGSFLVSDSLATFALQDDGIFPSTVASGW